MAKILVTGAMGFIGGYVVEELLKSGYEVIGVDNFGMSGVGDMVYREYGFDVDEIVAAIKAKMKHGRF